MFSDISYFDFNEKKDLVYYFFRLMFDLRKDEILNSLDSYINFKGNAFNEDIFIDFASEFSEKDEEYFGRDKVAFSFCYPFLEEDCIVLVDYKQFYDSLVCIFKVYMEDFLEDEIKQINEKLNILKEKLKL